MSNNILEISHKHGEEMRRIALQHALEIAKLYRDYSDKPIEDLITHLETKIAEEEAENDAQ